MTNCKLSFICSQQWTELKKGNDSAVRHCDTCNTDVFAVHDATEFELHKSQGHCVALFPEDAACTLGMPDFEFGDGWASEPLLYRPPSELDELPAHMLKTFQGHALKGIGDIVILNEVKVLELLQSSQSDLAMLNDVLAGRGLTLGMRLDGWTR